MKVINIGGWLACTAVLLGAVSVVAAEAETSSEDAAALQEVVVTAQRRSERIQDVPIAVNAVSGEALSDLSVTGTENLQAVVPALVVVRQANGATPYLRGVGFASGDVNAENSVATYVDGVYQPVSQGNFFQFNNIDRIEVLKGPQGTLFGRNATGGVIQVITKDPSFVPSADVSVGAANYRTFSGAFYGTTAVVPDRVAVDLAATGEQQNEGWGHDLITNVPTYRNADQSFRGKLLVTPDEKTRILLAADYYHYNNGGLEGQAPFGLSGDPAGLSGTTPVRAYVFPGNTAFGPFPAGSGFPGRYNTVANFPDSAHGTNEGLSLKIEREFSPFQVRSITAYRRFSGVWVFDQDLSPVNVIGARLNQNAQTFSEEVHLLAPADARFQWLAGAYYFRHDASEIPQNLASDFAFLDITGVGAIPPLGSFDIRARTIATSIAGFAQGTYPLTDTLNLTLGFRETHDKSALTGQQDGNLLTGGVVPLVPRNTSEFSYNKPTWRISLDQKLASDLMGYFAYNRGVKSGNFSLSVPSAAGLYKPEQLDAFEIGLKSELFGRRLRLNADAFYYDYKNMQFQKIVQGATQTFNADSATIYGVEFDAEARVTPALTLLANGSYLHSRIGNFPWVATLREPNGQSANTPPGTYNAQGNQTPNSPKVSGNVGFVYGIPVRIGSVSLSGNLYFTDRYFVEPDNRLYVQGHILLSAGARWSAPGDKLSVFLWGKNLTNVYYYQQLTGQDSASDVSGAAAPRTYGVTVGYKF